MMQAWKEHQLEHFKSLPLVATGWDSSKGVEMRFYMLPGVWHYVGITDGSRAFIAPAEHNPFGVDCSKAIQGFLTGKGVLRAPKRVRVVVE